MLDNFGSAFKMRFHKLELLNFYAVLANSYCPGCSLASALCLLRHLTQLPQASCDNWLVHCIALLAS